MISIRRYLVRTLAITLIAVSALSVVAAYLISQHELEEILDAQLSLEARIMASFLPDSPNTEVYRALSRQLSQPDHPAQLYDDLLTDTTAQTSAAALFHHEEKKVGLGFWNAQGRPLMMGPRWHETSAFPAPREEGFRWVDYEGRRWRVFSLFDSNSETWLRIGLQQRFHQSIVNRITINHLWPMLLMMPLALWLMMRAIRRGLTPIEQLSRQVRGRDQTDLSPISLSVPRELDGLHRALNDFITRLGEALQKERRFTADAAHELRTPLAGLKIQLDNAVEGEAASLDKARIGIERLQRVVEQLLILARLDQRQQHNVEKIDVGLLVEDLAAELWPLAESRGQTLEIAGTTRAWEEPCYVTANATELGILIRNLLDNAMRYTPDEGRVTVSLDKVPQGLQLIIRDTGPGIPEALLGSVTQRFRRASSQSISGSGLGLSIAVALAKRQHAELKLRNHERGGLEVRLEWHDPSSS
ncbi:ATP-binding protein [Halomonas halodenitrificans]|uniref:ATP-binding protein n=1 Tax=Halomonas halodenitrificans TaxID=28252 RepID=UPI00047F5ABA|nr:ATP-binding protein [Halomonas halodenitrificans]